MKRGRILAVLTIFAAIVIAVIVVAVAQKGTASALVTSSTSATAASSTDTTASAASSSTDTTAAPTTTTLAGVVDKTDEETGNLLVSELKAWLPTFNAGNLVETSTLLTFFTSETEAYTWLTMLKENAGDNFVQELNSKYDALRADYWAKAPTAAANMISFLAKEKPWLIAAVSAIVGEDNWSKMSASDKMVAIDKMTWSTPVVAPASFRTTGADVNHPKPTDPAFRTVLKAENLVISPDDEDWVPTLVDAFLPSQANLYLKDKGIDTRVREVLDNDTFVIEIVKGDQVTKIEIDRKVAVPVIVKDETGNKVVAEAVFSTACGNPTLPEFEPPRKEVTTTTGTTPTTKPPKVTTTTGRPTTTTTNKPTTTTTQPSTTTTVKPPPVDPPTTTTSTTNKPTTTTTPTTTTPTTVKPPATTSTTAPLPTTTTNPSPWPS